MVAEVMPALDGLICTLSGCTLIAMTSRDIITALIADGWYEVACKGSHVQFRHDFKPGRVTVPHPRKDMPLGTLRSIEKQSGLKLR